MRISRKCRVSVGLDHKAATDVSSGICTMVCGVRLFFQFLETVTGSSMQVGGVHWYDIRLWCCVPEDPKAYLGLSRPLTTGLSRLIPSCPHSWSIAEVTLRHNLKATHSGNTTSGSTVDYAVVSRDFPMTFARCSASFHTSSN